MIILPLLLVSLMVFLVPYAIAHVPVEVNGTAADPAPVEVNGTAADPAPVEVNGTAADPAPVEVNGTAADPAPVEITETVLVTDKPVTVGDVIIMPQMSHGGMDGTSGVEYVPVEVTVTTQIIPEGEPDVEVLPWHIRNGYDSKILPLLQSEIDTGIIQCITDNGPGTCPVPKDENGRSMYFVTIVLEEIPMWPDGRPYPYTKDARTERIAQISEIAAVRQQPIVDLLFENNQTLVDQLLSINFIHANVTADFLPLLEAREEVLFVESGNAIFTAGG